MIVKIINILLINLCLFTITSCVPRQNEEQKDSQNEILNEISLEEGKYIAESIIEYQNVNKESLNLNSMTFTLKNTTKSKIDDSIILNSDVIVKHNDGIRYEYYKEVTPEETVVGEEYVYTKNKLFYKNDMEISKEDYDSLINDNIEYMRHYLDFIPTFISAAISPTQKDFAEYGTVTAKCYSSNEGNLTIEINCNKDNDVRYFKLKYDNNLFISSYVTRELSEKKIEETAKMEYKSEIENPYK